MNGVHDMGGMQGFGPVVAEANEPRFHATWERRAFALTLGMGALGQWNLDQSRFARESLPPAQYLASSYYQIWLEALIRLLLERDLVAAEELADGRMRNTPGHVPSPLAANAVPTVLSRGGSTERRLGGKARFAVGDRVRTLNINPPTHTRLPRYCRGKPATIVKVHGAHVFPDSNALGAGEQPQWLYAARFEAVDLWGPDTTVTTVNVDCWEPYLEPR